MFRIVSDVSHVWDSGDLLISEVFTENSYSYTELQLTLQLVGRTDEILSAYRAAGTSLIHCVNTNTA